MWYMGINYVATDCYIQGVDELYNEYFNEEYLKDVLKFFRSKAKGLKDDFKLYRDNDKHHMIDVFNDILLNKEIFNKSIDFSKIDEAMDGDIFHYLLDMHLFSSSSYRVDYLNARHRGDNSKAQEICLKIRKGLNKCYNYKEKALLLQEKIYLEGERKAFEILFTRKDLFV